MDPLLPRKPQDVDRWSDEAERDPRSDPATGPGDRWVNESARSDPDYPAPAAGDGGIEPDVARGKDATADEADPDVAERKPPDV